MFEILHHSFFRASPVAEMVKNPPAMQETWVQSLGQEDSMEKEMATHYLGCLGNSMDRGVTKESDTT